MATPSPPATEEFDVDGTFAAAYRGAVTGADAYRAVRTAVRLERGLLRLGNRFVALDRYRDIAFVALGNASSSLALAAWEGLGERLTQGIVAGPIEPPSQIPFRHWTVPPGLPGSRAGMEVAEAVDELARELTAKDLLLLLLSPGALGALSLPPAGIDGVGWRGFLSAASSAGLSGGEVALLARVLGRGPAGGGLLPRAGAGEIETLVLDRGDGGETVGGGPTVPISNEEFSRAAALHGALSTRVALAPLLGAALSAPPPSGAPPRRGLHRPVVLLGPGDALAGASDAMVDRRWVCRLADRSSVRSPESAAERLAQRAEEILRGLGKVPGSGATKDRRHASRGLAVFSGLTLGLPEGVDESPMAQRFLAALRPRLVHPGSLAAIFPTAGSLDRRDAGAYVRAGESAPPLRRGLEMRAGLSDVGSVAMLLLPASP